MADMSGGRKFRNYTDFLISSFSGGGRRGWQSQMPLMLQQPEMGNRFNSWGLVDRIQPWWLRGYGASE